MIHLYVHGRGRGHTTRCLAIARVLDAAGHRFRAFVGRDGVELFSTSYPCTEVASLPPHLGPATVGIAVRIRDAVTQARRDDARIIVSDGDLPGLLAASVLRRPSIAVGHGLIFSECRRPSSLPKGPWLREAAKAAASSMGADASIAVNFVPLEARRRRATVARPTLDPRLHRTDASDTVLCYFRDGAPKVLRALVRLGTRPVLFSSIPSGVDGVQEEPQDRTKFIEALSRARVVIATAGSQLISECVNLRIPILALHATDDDEQRLNAAMVREAGLGDGCSFDALTPRRLRHFVETPPRLRPQHDPRPDVAAATLTAIDAMLSRSLR